LVEDDWSYYSNELKISTFFIRVDSFPKIFSLIMDSNSIILKLTQLPFSRGLRASTAARTDSAVQRELAARLAKDVIRCDPAVISLIVFTKTGEVVAVRNSPRLKETDYVDRETIKLLGIRASVVLSSANTVSEIMGKTESVIAAYKNFKVLLIGLTEYDLALGIQINRSANGESISTKIQDLLASS